MLFCFFGYFYIFGVFCVVVIFMSYGMVEFLVVGFLLMMSWCFFGFGCGRRMYVNVYLFFEIVSGYFVLWWFWISGEL